MDLGRDLAHVRVGVDVRQLTLLAVEVDHRLGLLVEGLETRAERGLVVVLALDQGSPVMSSLPATLGGANLTW